MAFSASGSTIGLMGFFFQRRQDQNKIVMIFEQIQKRGNVVQKMALDSGAAGMDKRVQSSRRMRERICLCR